jgi:dTDP-4-amino-4,6-dideoxyglucose
VKTSIDSLAVFGGPPLFERSRPIGQLTAPDVEEFLGSLRAVFELRRLTNDGPLVQQLERRLAAFHDTRHCVALANAGIGITMLLQLFARGRRGEVIMPSFSYRGLPHFARWAGQEPRFCDVEEDSHALDPRAVEAAINSRTTAILAVCNCHSTGDIAGLCRAAERAGIPILFDSVDALGGTHRDRRLGGFGQAEVYSVHATKLLNGFEGGYITTNIDRLAALLRWQRNFCLAGFEPAGAGADEDLVLGVNAKLNEIHAAMALLSLDRLDETVNRNRARASAYRAMCDGLPGIQLVLSPRCEALSNCARLVAELTMPWPLSRDQMVALLRAEGMPVAAYYHPLLHWSDALGDGPRQHLPVSEALAGRFLQLPSGDLVSIGDIGSIDALLKFVAVNGGAIRSRLADAGVA